jgi:hypothetical protein
VPSLEHLEDRLAPATVSWNVDTSGDWNNPANWSTGTVPAASDDVVINRTVPVTVTISSGNQAANSLQASNNETLVVSGGSLTVAASSSAWNVTVSNGASLAVSSMAANAIAVQQGGVLKGYGHELDLTVSGQVSVDATSSIDVTGEGYGMGVTTGGTTTGAATGLSSGSYGGLGGSLSGSPNAVYGDYTNPTDWGQWLHR